MAGWLERAAGPGGPVLALVYAEIAVALALLVGVLHFRRLRERRDELRAVRLYFAALFTLLLVLPCLIVALAAGRPLGTLASFGWRFGRAGLGVPLALGGMAVAVLAGWTGSRDPGMRQMYPFAKAACANARTFAVYELSYLVFYYLPWESVFRGALFLPLVPAIGLVPALAVQTALSTALHAGHPDLEIFAAAAAGPAFGLIAYATGSFFYPFVIHAAAGIATDTFLFLRARRGVS